MSEPVDKNSVEPVEEAAVSPAPLAPGSVVEGKVSRTTSHHVYLDLPEGATGLLDLEELEDIGETALFVEGHVSPVYVMNFSEQGGYHRLSRVLARGGRSSEDLQRCFDEGVAVDGKITAARKGGFDVFIAGQRAFLPASQVDIKAGEDKERYVGRIDRFKIIDLNLRRNNVVVSRRKILEREARAIKEELCGAIDAGQEFDGEIKQLKEYGAFIDIGGIEGLVHVTELSWNRVDHPSELLKVGETVRVQVLRYGTETGKLSLTIKRLYPNPWSLLGTEYEEGSVYPGKVTRFEEYGAFVELAPGLEGLVHNSEASWDGSVRHAQDVVDVGEEVQVKLLSFERKRRRISLSIKGTTEDPWGQAAEDYPVGSMAEGVVERVAKFGVFVALGSGVTALLPVSRSGVPREISLHRRFHPGAPIKAEVIEVDARRRRVTLSLAGSDEHMDRDVSKFLEKQQKEKVSLGTLGDLLAGFKDEDEDSG